MVNLGSLVVMTATVLLGTSAAALSAGNLGASVDPDGAGSSPPSLDAYGLVVIAPEAFTTALQPLIDHKNANGLTSTLLTMEEILTTHEGYDDAEKVKRCIWDAYTTWGIDYVLLVGGLTSHWNAKDKDSISCGTSAWHVPVRYVSIPQESDEGCLCDLYYGCLMDGNGTFSSWDSNGDGIYAAWGLPGVEDDTFDLIPEVAVGRLPVATVAELSRVVAKIIDYESTGPDAKPWYSTMVAISGSSGEETCNISMDFMEGVIDTRVTCFESAGGPPTVTTIASAVSAGAGYVMFQGTGNPIHWGTTWHDGNYPGDWLEGITIYQRWRLRNEEKLPIVVVGGSHDGLYNVSLIPSLRDKAGESYFTYGLPAPVCFSWSLVLKQRGGAIASTGNTGYGFQGDNISLCSKLDVNFFYEIGQRGATTLGQAYNGAVAKFIAEESIGQVETYCITSWQLFGDPSLRFGGYPRPPV